MNFSDLTGNGHTLDGKSLHQIDGIFGGAVFGAYGNPLVTTNVYATAGTDAVFNINHDLSMTFAILTCPKNFNLGDGEIFAKKSGASYEYKLTVDQAAFTWTFCGVSAVHDTQSSPGYVQLVICYYDHVRQKIGIQVDGAGLVEADVSGATIEHIAGSVFNMLEGTPSAVHALYLWNRVLPLAQRTELLNGTAAANYKFIPHPFTTPAADTSYSLNFDGDSLTKLRVYPLCLLDMCGRGHPYKNISVGGQTMQTILANAANADAMYDAGYTKNFLFIRAGTNDINAGRTAQQIHDDLASYCTGRQTTGFTVIAFTISPNTAYDNTVRNAANALILADWETWADGLVDVSSLPVAYASLPDYHYIGDGVHYTSAGEAEIATLAKTVLDGLL
jgi:hypothetical protein